MNTKIPFHIFWLFLVPFHIFGQGIINQAGANIRLLGTANLNLKNASFTSAGTFAPGSSNVVFSGNVAQTTNFTGTANFNTLSINNTAGVTLNNATATNALIISSGALTVPAGRGLSASGTTTLSSPECLILKSDAGGTASFIDNGTISGTGTSRVERYLTPYGVVSDIKFHFIASPVGNAQSIQNEFINLAGSDITDFYKWNEVANEWTNFRGLTYKSRNESFGDGFMFVAGKGYMVAYPAAVTKKFIGAPFTGDVTLTCTNTANRGWNLLGNPFPSSLDWDLVAKGNGMDNALYYYDNGSPTPGYKYYIYLTGGLSGGTKNIPPMQGFMVHAKTSGTQTLTFTNSARIHDGQNAFFKKSEPLIANILNMKVEGNGVADYARVCFYDQATENFDSDFDAYKLFSYSETIPQLYSITSDNTPLAINTLPITKMNNIVPVGFKAGSAGNFIFTAENLQSFDASVLINLNDLKTGTTQNLSNNPVYRFTSSDGDLVNRFELVFASTTGIRETNAADFDVYVEGSFINIRTNNNIQPSTVLVSNMLGQVVSKSRLTSNYFNSINMSRIPGVYLVTVISNGRTSSRKVVIH